MGLKLQGPSLLSNMFLRLIHLLTMIANTKQDSAKIYVFLAHYKMKYVYKQPPDILWIGPPSHKNVCMIADLL